MELLRPNSSPVFANFTVYFKILYQLILLLQIFLAQVAKASAPPLMRPLYVPNIESSARWSAGRIHIWVVSFELCLYCFLLCIKLHYFNLLFIILFKPSIAIDVANCKQNRVGCLDDNSFLKARKVFLLPLLVLVCNRNEILRKFLELLQSCNFLLKLVKT